MSRLPLPGPGSIAAPPQPPPGVSGQQQQLQQPPQPPTTRGPAVVGAAVPASSQDLSLRDLLERWAGSDETLRAVMFAKAEEDRLKQEVLRLEIRRQEMDMYREIARSGCPVHLIPTIFSGGATTAALGSAATGSTSTQLARDQPVQNIPPPPVPASSQMLAPSQIPQSSPRQPAPGYGIGPPVSPGPQQSRAPYAVGVIPPYRAQGPATSPQHVTKQEAAAGSVYGERPPTYSQPPRIGLGILPMPDAPLPRGQYYRQSSPPGEMHGPAGQMPTPQLQQQQQPSPAITATPQQSSRESRDQQSQPLFFHHWQPPTSAADREDDASTARVNSPTPKKRRVGLGSGGGGGSSGSGPLGSGLMTGPSTQLARDQQQQSSTQASRRSPVRGHSRHRSEASIMTTSNRYQDPVSWATGPASPATTFTQSRAREAPFTPSSSSIAAGPNPTRAAEGAGAGRMGGYDREMRDRDRDREQDEREQPRESRRGGGGPLVGPPSVGATGGSSGTRGGGGGVLAERERGRQRAQSGSTIPEENEDSPAPSMRSRD